ncbi:MAG: hypothetical protein GDA56_09690 [Hormoscilla sp. GM7CHS1pb]|nr:hypothetical protein [Hormoscilla sp. GM7CHS1pb]
MSVIPSTGCPLVILKKESVRAAVGIALRAATRERRRWEVKYDRIYQKVADGGMAKISTREIQDEMDRTYSSPTRVLTDVAKAEKEN